LGNKAYRVRNAELGLCRSCAAEALPLRRYCLKHLLYERNRNRRIPQAQRNRYAARKAEMRKRYKEIGRCPTCSAPKGEQDDGYVKCVNCRLEVTVPKRPRGTR
jgi:hypothetical protein